MVVCWDCSKVYVTVVRLDDWMGDLTVELLVELLVESTAVQTDATLAEEMGLRSAESWEC